MDRHRRDFLTIAGTVGFATLAGCTGSSDTETPASTSHPVLTATDADEGDRFGFAVSMSSDGSTALVGARTDEDPNGEKAGSAYVFNFDGGTWSQETKLAAADGGEKDHFGTSVSVSADGATALIGEHNTEAGGGTANSPYVFKKQGGTWTQRARLHATDRSDHDFFGREVALSDDGTTALVVAQNNDRGVAYVFHRNGGRWNQQAIISPDGDNQGAFGSSVALSENGETALIGSFFGTNSDGVGTGSAHIFEATGESWSQQAILTPSDGKSGDGFGSTVSLSADGTRALIGAHNRFVYQDGWTRAAYVFERSDSEWQQQTKFTPDSESPEDKFGRDVSLSGDGMTAIVGSPPTRQAETDKPGEVYVFDAANGNWSQQNVLTAGDGVMKDAFGFAVAVAADGSTGLAGAPGKEGPEEGTSPDETTALTSPTWDYEGRFAGAVYVLENL